MLKHILFCLLGLLTLTSTNQSSAQLPSASKITAHALDFTRKHPFLVSLPALPAATIILNNLFPRFRLAWEPSMGPKPTRFAEFLDVMCHEGVLLQWAISSWLFSGVATNIIANALQDSYRLHPEYFKK